MNSIEAKNYIDESTTESYKFVFHCDCCNKVILDYTCKNANCYKPKLFISASKQKAKELLWLKGHIDTLKIAKEQALETLNRCEVCGKLVCDDCIVERDDLKGGICCKDCQK